MILSQPLITANGSPMQVETGVVFCVIYTYERMHRIDCFACRLQLTLSQVFSLDSATDEEMIQRLAQMGHQDGKVLNSKGPILKPRVMM